MTYTNNTNTTTATNTIAADIIRRVERAAKTIRDMGEGKDVTIRSQGLIDGIMYAVEAMGCDADEIDALYNRIDEIIG